MYYYKHSFYKVHKIQNTYILEMASEINLLLLKHKTIFTHICWENNHE